MMQKKLVLMGALALGSAAGLGAWPFNVLNESDYPIQVRVGRELNEEDNQVTDLVAGPISINIGGRPTLELPEVAVPATFIGPVGPTRTIRPPALAVRRGANRPRPAVRRTYTRTAHARDEEVMRV